MFSSLSPLPNRYCLKEPRTYGSASPRSPKASVVPLLTDRGGQRQDLADGVGESYSETVTYRHHIQNKAWSDLALDLYYREVDVYSHLAMMLPDTVKRILTWADDLSRLTVISMRVCHHVIHFSILHALVSFVLYTPVYCIHTFPVLSTVLKHKGVSVRGAETASNTGFSFSLKSFHVTLNIFDSITASSITSLT